MIAMTTPELAVGGLILSAALYSLLSSRRARKKRPTPSLEARAPRQLVRSEAPKPAEVRSEFSDEKRHSLEIPEPKPMALPPPLPRYVPPGAQLIELAAELALEFPLDFPEEASAESFPPSFDPAEETETPPTVEQLPSEAEEAELDKTEHLALPDASPLVAAAAAWDEPPVFPTEKNPEEPISVVEPLAVSAASVPELAPEVAVPKVELAEVEEGVKLEGAPLEIPLPAAEIPDTMVVRFTPVGIEEVSMEALPIDAPVESVDELAVSPAQAEDTPEVEAPPPLALEAKVPIIETQASVENSGLLAEESSPAEAPVLSVEAGPPQAPEMPPTEGPPLSVRALIAKMNAAAKTQGTSSLATPTPDEKKQLKEMPSPAKKKRKGVPADNPDESR